MNLSGLLLAGGRSSRFGANKLKILSYGIPILADQVIKLCFLCEEITVCTSRENQKYTECIVKKIEYYIKVLGISKKINIPVIRITADEDILRDRFGIIGPLAGIYTGLKNSINDKCIVIASDMPFISFKLLETIKKTAEENPDFDSVIVKSHKEVEPLCGVYSKRYIKVIENNIRDGNYRISDALCALRVKWLDVMKINSAGIDIYNFFNINSMEDNTRFEKILKKGIEGYDPYNFSGKAVSKWEDNFFRGYCKGDKK
jgi:molybdenum cofactor guanylyltransferase